MSGYGLTIDASELQRLDLQGRVLAPATRSILQAAGVGPGMRVLDLGSGAGDVSFVAAELVGPTGSVVGIDQSPDSTAKAAARAADRDLSNVRFAVGDIHDSAPGGPFDAVVCRLVLMFVRDPAAVLRIHAAGLRPGGIVVPIEVDLPSARSLPGTPLVSQALSWLRQAFTSAGIHLALGPGLWSLLLDAGIGPQGMVAVQPHFGPEDPNGAALLAGLIRSALPLIERAGVATAAEVAVETLKQRISEELSTSPAVFAYPTLVSAWGSGRSRTGPRERQRL